VTPLKGRPPRRDPGDEKLRREHRHEFATALDLVIRELDLSQVEVARRIGHAQQTISKWLTDERPPENPYTIFQVEQRLGLSPGYLSHHLGYVPVGSVSTAHAISTDESLAPEFRPVVLRLYRELIAVSRLRDKE
jgi:transcriptional regulator with XRE-family HTH domain